MSGFFVLDCCGWGNEKGRWLVLSQVEFTSNLDDLDYADDVVLISSTKQLIQDKTARMDAEATRLRSTINMEKTKVTRINAKNQELIMIAGQGVTEVDEFIWELQFLRREVV